MAWEVLATWITLLITVATGVFAMGKQAQKIDSQQGQIDELKGQIKAAQELPAKLAVLETDMKYLIKELSEVKTLLIDRGR